jgi:hypothetical protein
VADDGFEEVEGYTAEKEEEKSMLMLVTVMVRLVVELTAST